MSSPMSAGDAEFGLNLGRKSDGPDESGPHGRPMTTSEGPISAQAKRFIRLTHTLPHHDKPVWTDVLPDAWDEQRRKALRIRRADQLQGTSQYFKLSKFSLDLDGPHGKQYNLDTDLAVPLRGFYHIYPIESFNLKCINRMPLPLPEAIARDIDNGVIFPEFIDALRGFVRRTTSWNVGAARVHEDISKSQCCFVLNFVLPNEHLEMLSTAYASVAALIYLSGPFVLILSNTDALCRIISETTHWAKLNHQMDPTQIPVAALVHLAQISTKGFSTVLSVLESEVRYYVLLHMNPISKDAPHHVPVRTGAEITTELEALSRSLRINAEAMALLQCVPSREPEGKKPHLGFDSSKHRTNVIIDEIYQTDIAPIEPMAGQRRPQDLEQFFRLMMRRTDTLMKMMLEKEAKDARDGDSTLLEQQLKLTYLSRAMNRVLGLTVLFFLPGIFVSTLFSSSFFEFSDKGIVVTRSFWMLWAIIIPISVFVFGAAFLRTTSLQYWIQNKVRIFCKYLYQRKRKADVEKGYSRRN